MYSNKCCECKCVVKDDTKCQKCLRPYHNQCLPKRLVTDEASGDIIGCTICVKKSKKGKTESKKRKISENESEDEECEIEMNDKIAKLLDEKISNLKVFFEIILEEKTEELRKEIKALKSELEIAKQPKRVEGQGALTFSEVLQKKNNTVIIKPSNTDKEIDIVKEIKSKVDVANLSIGIKEIKANKKGTVVIKCNNEKNQTCLREEIKNKMNNDVKIVEPTQYKYNMKVVGIHGDMIEKTNEELISTIRKQNDILKKEATIEIKKRISLKNSWSLIIELDGVSHEQLLKQKIVYLGWQRCKVFDRVNVRRCFKCWGYGHTQATCQKDTACNHCAEKHDSRTCPNINKIKKCLNCVNQKIKYNLKDLNVNHEATDLKCPYYLRILKKINRNE